MLVVSMESGRNLNALCFENSKAASVLFDWHLLFLHFILSPNLFLSNLLTKNEDLTSEAGLSN